MKDEKIIVIDVCAGKGFLSFLLSYMKHTKVHRIVMLEKAQIDWHHIQASNVSAVEENRPMIDIWEQTNLHDYDNVLERMIYRAFIYVSNLDLRFAVWLTV